MNNSTVRKQLGGMPTGPYKLTEQRSRIVRHEVETGLTAEDHEAGVWVSVVRDLHTFREREQR